jgi:hypothetical protein|nr:MAG TPA: hypothetical protein [Caudoviricetes sp.]
MNNIKKNSPVYLKDYDVHVNQYLTYAQIQQIVNSVAKIDTWSEREQNIDMLILLHATDIGIDSLEKNEHNVLLESGLIDSVKENIRNLSSVYDAIKYNESIQRSLIQITRELPKYLNKVEEVMKSGVIGKK